MIEAADKALLWLIVALFRFALAWAALAAFAMLALLCWVWNPRRRP